MKIKTNKSVAQAYESYATRANAKNSDKAIYESWAPTIQKITGVEDTEKLAWMSQLAHNTAKLNEDAFVMPSNAYSQFGGTYQPYNNLYNTVGVGDPTPAGKPALTGADYADNRNLGSGDKYPTLLPLALKVAAKTIGFELVNTTPLQGPTGVLPYMDYVYSGSKQPYGATPAYSAKSQNPMANSQTNAPFEMYGLPHAFKASIAPGEATVADSSTVDSSQVVTMSPAQIKRALKGATAMPAGTTLVSATDFADFDGSHPHVGTSNALVVEFVGWSRIDGDPMFKVVAGTQSLGAYFNGGSLDFQAVYTPVGSDQEVNLTLTLHAPRLISMLEDQIQGFTGAGERDRDAWYGTYQDGTTLYEPMSRGTGEQTMARQLSLQLFTKHVQVGTIMVGCAVTQEQVTDLQKQWGIDVVKMVENAGINELSATINRHITSRLFALGWKNHYKLVEVEGPAANLNLSFDPSYTATSGVRMTPALAIPQGDDNSVDGVSYKSYVNVALPYKPMYIPSGAAFENRDTLLKRLAVNFLAASNWILQRGRYGAATFAVTNITIATLLQSNANYTFSPIANTISQNGGSLYPIGGMFGLTIYVDPLMAGSDNRVLVGRKGGKDEPGVHFCPYVMAESVQIIAEGTMAPKLMIKSRYALVDAGFYPETQYLTFCVDVAGL
ncbi:MAG: hypothetical protein [Hatfieldvirus porci]|uniref:Major capsid protein n=1 Tax=phage Lak_Megaphage_RVC_JS4_GC31 TaxID=3109228 RepID=A0ABZ0Z1R6_9CAUD|nr:MAG: hypothetical protein [phage Lak_Megaphage_RVC_AP3_GC31]WQJ52981.1 MAG: hypothetical protein [phage Lak_Megaphage_RVC_JS4_GC31]